MRNEREFGVVVFRRSEGVIEEEEDYRGEGGRKEGRNQPTTKSLLLDVRG